jgi:uncharacterized membrane protein YfcA
MSHIDPASYLLLAAASFLAGGINAVAGGGTLLTFPTLLACGVSPVVANATNTVALVPASLAGAYSFRKELPNIRRTIKLFALPSIVGGFVGAKLMLVGGDHVLAMLVPWLILGASVLFLLQEPISRLAAKRAQKQGAGGATEESPDAQLEHSHLQNVPGVITFMFLVAVYGGYFGAGIGILTLAALGFLGLTNIHQMNGVKNILTASINLVATITFVLAGRIDGLIALLMSCGTILGALSSAGIALKLGQRRVRQLIIAIGFSITALMFYKQAHGGL